MKKTVGIVGGMGPEATAILFLKIIKNTPAATDQEHLHCLIDSNPSVPDRTAAIVGKEESPLPILISMSRRLCEMGADFLIMPCNTAHYYINELRRAVDVPFLSMIEETFKEVKKLADRGERIGLLATDGTIQAGVYEAVFADYFDIYYPRGEWQNKVMEAIYRGVKAGNISYARGLLLEVAEKLVSEGSRVIIGGCTEIPIALQQKDLKVPFVDTIDALAKASVKFAMEA